MRRAMVTFPAALAALALGLALADSALAQQQPILRLAPQVQDQPAQSVPSVPAPPVAVPVARAGAAVVAQPAVPPSPRLQKLQQLIVDRRPSSILEAWSKPREKEPDRPEISTPEPAAAEGPADATSVAASDAEEPGKTSPAAAAGANASGSSAIGGSATSDGAAGSGAEVSGTAAAAAGGAAASAAGATAAAPGVAEVPNPAIVAPGAEPVKPPEIVEWENAVLEWEIRCLQRALTLGEWETVRSTLAGYPEDESKAAYAQILASLEKGPPPKSPPNPQLQQWAEKNVFAAADVIAIAGLAPLPRERKQAEILGRLLAESLGQGHLLERFLELARAEVAGETARVERRTVARMLVTAGRAAESIEFLPSPEEAEAGNDREALNLLASAYVAKEAKERGEGDWLERAWRANLAALAAGEVEEEQKEEALRRALELAPRLREELGQVWLEESFTARPERGREILAGIGSIASEGLVRHASDPDFRKKTLELLSTAAEALLAAAPEQAGEWSVTLQLLGESWLREAVFSSQYDQSTARAPRLRRDPFGNYFYYDPSQGPGTRGPNMPVAIPRGSLLEVRPSEAWLSHADPGLQPKFQRVTAQLLLEVEEEIESFPYIERLATTHPDLAKELVDEFLRVWARNHDPNQNTGNTNPYMFMYGFEVRSASIPLTRSKQERNLAELAEWVSRLRALPLEKIDEKLLADAFVKAHSIAEVYRVETIEGVFGSLGALEPATLAQLTQKMRSNLVGVWRQPEVQRQNRTNRRQQDLQQEVLHGYAVARTVVREGLDRHTGDWALTLALASIDHDENNFRAELERSSEYASRRREAFASFREAAARYAAAAPGLAEEEETTEPFETWFYAALGACDLNAIESEMVLAQDQIPAIRAALAALPGESAERHLGRFANTLFTRMSSVNPAVKFRYVRAGLEIVGDHERAAEARDVYEYYRDLLTELKLEVRVDGSDVVGHGAPFGIFVDIRHTREIERESGGFGKYLTNQNNQNFSFNYGRPTENYRERFEEAAHAALDEHFMVRSVTFNHPNTTSKAEEEYGWRRTPYAYILLEARGPQIDRIPALHIDFDCLDTSGYVVLPVESAPVPIDCGADIPTTRPFAEARVTQLLDERQAAEGKLILEVAVRGLGVPPPLKSLIDLAPEGFEIAEVEDQGVSMVEFSTESAQTAVLGERTWWITLRGGDDLATRPESFTYPTVKIETVEVAHRRYVDADLEDVEAKISLDPIYGEVASPWPKRLLAAGGTLTLLILAVALVLRRPRRVVAESIRVPTTFTPFTVIGLLRAIERSGAVGGGDLPRLEEDIRELERHYFSRDNGADVDLREIADAWVRRASAGGLPADAAGS